MTKTWGSGQRTSRHINKRTTQSIFRGFDYAAASGRTFNTYVVINLRDDAEHGPTQTFTRILHRYRDWLTYRRRKGLPVELVYTYTFENPHGSTHVNWVLRLPPGTDKEFEKKLARWVERVQGALGPYDIHIQPVTPGYEKRLAKYIVKGTDPQAVRHFFYKTCTSPRASSSAAAQESAVLLVRRHASGPAIIRAAAARMDCPPRPQAVRMPVIEIAARTVTSTSCPAVMPAVPATCRRVRYSGPTRPAVPLGGLADTGNVPSQGRSAPPQTLPSPIPASIRHSRDVRTHAPPAIEGRYRQEMCRR